GEGIVLTQHIAIGEVVFVARRLRRRERGKGAAAGSGIAWPGHSAVGRRDGREIERRAATASAGSADRLIACIRAHAVRCGGGVHRPERVRRTGRVRALQGIEGIEGIAAPAGRRDGRRGRSWRARLQRRSWNTLLLHAADLALELLVAKLQLLDRSG